MTRHAALTRSARRRVLGIELLLRARALIWARAALKRHPPGSPHHTEARAILATSARETDRRMAR